MSEPALCETCEGTGFVPVQPARGERVQRCPTCRVKTATIALGVPLEFKDATLETYRETPANLHAKQFATTWCTATGDGLYPQQDVYLFGPVGTGKTRLAVSMLNEMCRRGARGLFERVPMFLLRLQPSDVEHSDLFWRACEAPILVLDDLGAEREVATDFTRRTLLMLYEERCDRGHRTIWTSNLKLAKLAEAMVDERLVSRIKGRSEIFELEGADWRVRRRRSA